jgi:signal transduction histidine kinase
MCVNANVINMAGQNIILIAFEDITVRVEAELSRKDALRQLFRSEEKERHRLALELHDETGQHVTAFLLGLGKLKEEHGDRQESRALVEELQRRAEELARHLHGISLQLRPTALDEHGLVRALTNYVEDLSIRHHVDIDLHTETGGDRMPSQVETVLYRVTQEALTNVLKHSGSSKVSVVLARKNQDVSLIIEDDGNGFDPGKVMSDGNKIHLGLRGMRERLALVGGTLTVESEPGHGTTVFARIPLKGRDDGDDTD